MTETPFQTPEADLDSGLSSRITASSRTALRFIGLLEIVGGVVGLGIIGALAVQSEMLGLAWLLLAVFGALFAVSIYVGVQLWRIRDVGIRWSIVLQFLQVIYVVSPVIAYNFFLGAWLTVGMIGFNLNFGFMVGSNFNFYLLNESSGFGFGVNLVAIFAVSYLLKTRKKLKAADVSQS